MGYHCKVIIISIICLYPLEAATILQFHTRASLMWPRPTSSHIILAGSGSGLHQTMHMQDDSGALVSGFPLCKFCHKICSNMVQKRIGFRFW